MTRFKRLAICFCMGIIIPAMLFYFPSVSWGQNYAASHKGSSDILPPVFSGSGLNDIVVSGTYTGSGETCYEVAIDATGTPDTFKWRPSRTFGSYTSGVSVATSATALSNGVSVAWKAATGHTVGGTWEFCGKAVSPLIIKGASGVTIVEVKNDSTVSRGSASITSQNKYISGPVVGADGTNYVAMNKKFVDIAGTTTLTEEKCGQIFQSDNDGNAKTYTLPNMIQGCTFGFYVGGTGLLTVNVDSGDTVRCNTNSSTTGVTSSTRGEGIEIFGSKIANEWQCRFEVGTMTYP